MDSSPSALTRDQPVRRESILGRPVHRFLTERELPMIDQPAGALSVFEHLYQTNIPEIFVPIRANFLLSQVVLYVES